MLEIQSAVVRYALKYTQHGHEVAERTQWNESSVGGDTCDLRELVLRLHHERLHERRIEHKDVFSAGQSHGHDVAYRQHKKACGSNAILWLYGSTISQGH